MEIFPMSQRIELTNPSAFFPLRVFHQDRLRSPYAPGLVPRTVKLTTREEFEQLGSRNIMVKSRGTVREADGNLRQVEREVPTPFFKTAGFGDLAGFITENMEKQLRESQQAPRTAPPVQRTVDDWSAPHPLQLIPPGGKAVLPLVEEKRFLIECLEEEVGLQIQNESATRTMRIRNRDSKSGAVSNVSHLAPQQVGTVTANGKSAAVVELTPQ
jgi:hypothetical protein